MARTIEEIVTRINDRKYHDFLGTQGSDLVGALPYEAAKPFLNDEFIKKHEAGEEKWEPTTDFKKEILEYLPFAFGKAWDERGISAERSLYHLKTWIWLDGNDAFYEKVLPFIENYTDYGLPALRMIAEEYGYTDQDVIGPT